MSGQTFAFAPAVDGIFGDAQVLGYVEGSDPGFGGHIGMHPIKILKSFKIVVSLPNCALNDYAKFRSVLRALLKAWI
ncbi:hypothetical protein MAH1_02820 [Sessilibacter sp. MAH1]